MSKDALAISFALTLEKRDSNQHLTTTHDKHTNTCTWVGLCSTRLYHDSLAICWADGKDVFAHKHRCHQLIFDASEQCVPQFGRLFIDDDVVMSIHRVSK